MSSGETRIRVLWARLVTDPADARFFRQKVSTPSEEDPDGSAVGDAVWWFPPAMAGGPADHLRRIDWNTPAGVCRLTDPEFASLLLLGKRFVVAQMRHPYRGMLRLGSIKRQCYPLFKLLDFIASETFRKGRQRLADLRLADMKKFVRQATAGWRANSTAWDALDWLFQEIDRHGRAGRLGDCFEKIALGDLRDLCSTEFGSPVYGVQRPDRHLFTTPPLPDKYCAAMLGIAECYDHLASDVIEHAGVFAQMRREETRLLARTKMDLMDPRRARMKYAEFARDYHWPLDRLPFAHTYEFPPRTSGHFLDVLSTFQGANMQRTAFCTGARDGELLGMDDDCISDRIAGDEHIGFAKSVRFKHAAAYGGDIVEWPVPDIVIGGLQNQLRLSGALGNPGVWACIAYDKFGRRLKASSAPFLRAFVKRHLLSELLKEDAEDDRREERPGMMRDPAAIGLQRFRPTIARLVLLGPNGHPRLVKRMLGHRDIATTMMYLAMSPFIQAELAFAARSYISAPQQDVPLRRLIELSSSPKADELAALIAGAEVQDRLHARLIAPGIVSMSDGDSGPEMQPPDWAASFDQTGVVEATFDFAVDRMACRETRNSKDLFAWYLREGRSMALRHPAVLRRTYRDARRRAVLGLIRGAQDAG